jgi:hypothetical protein
VKLHLLRPESITPIARYLERREHNPDSFAAQLELAIVVLYREREYRTMYQSGWLMGTQLPSPAPDSPFAPYDLTEEAAANLRSILGPTDGLEPDTTYGAPDGADDLFGLKTSAADGLGRTLRPIRSHRFGWVVYARLLQDLRRFSESRKGSKQAVALGEKLEKKPDALDERIRKNAVRIRAAVEGKAFTRYFTTELAFCQSERKAALKGFDAARVPKELRHLVPLARALGVGDDPCRALFVRKIPLRERRAAARAIREAGAAIDAWLALIGGPPFQGEAAAFFWLREAAEEIG